MEKFVGSFEMMSLADILGFENESDLFNKQAKVCISMRSTTSGRRTNRKAYNYTKTMSKMQCTISQLASTSNDHTSRYLAISDE